MINDFGIALRFWSVLFLIGASAYPLTRVVFRRWYDQGYLLSKAVGLFLVSYLVWLFSSLRILPFNNLNIVTAMVILYVSGLLINHFRIALGSDNMSSGDLPDSLKSRHFLIIIVSEIFFLSAFLLWVWVKAHEPDIRSLEKFMDFGFAKTILQSSYFPPPDMWYAGGSINYYYFGHYVMALLTKLSGLDLSYTFNLMLSALFGLTFTMSWGIGYQLFSNSKFKSQKSKLQFKSQNLFFKFTDLFKGLIAGGLTAFLVSLAGNMQTLYAFTRGYTGENVKPFWELLWGIGEFWQKLPEGLNTYWYANATRFIPFTIHEFPSYSFVVSDVHGHVLSLPFTILSISLILEIFVFGLQAGSGHLATAKFKISRMGYFFITLIDKWMPLYLYGLLVAVLFMTNALDGPIYFGLFVLVTLLIKTSVHKIFSMNWIEDKGWRLVPLFLAGPALLPFILNFKSFVSGVAVNCPPANLANRTFGPLIFEGVEKCQHSPLWMWWLLWGFFIFNGVTLILSNTNIKFLILNLKSIINLKLSKLKNSRSNTWTADRQYVNYKFLSIEFTQLEKILIIFFCYCLGLLIFPEFLYFRDIYPAHFRSNTMFKLGYQAFIMLSILSGYTIVKIILIRNNLSLNSKFPALPAGRQIPNSNQYSIFQFPIFKVIFLVLLVPQLFLVSIYPIFSVRSYFDSLRTYKGIYGLNWMKTQYPDDYEAINWLNDQNRLKFYDLRFKKFPVIVEADGDSYTDYARISAFTGLPAIIGWPVHEWLWRGSYDVVSPRREEVRTIYEGSDAEKKQEIIKKYGVKYIIVGTMERQKYPNIDTGSLESIAKPVFRSGSITIYEVL